MPNSGAMLVTQGPCNQGILYLISRAREANCQFFRARTPATRAAVAPRATPHLTEMYYAHAC